MKMINEIGAVLAGGEIAVQIGLDWDWDRREESRRQEPGN
jgi:hypothetical protein